MNFSHFLTNDEDFESKQFQVNDPFEDFNGQLVAEVNGVVQGDKITFYVKKSKLKIHSTFPKIFIISAFYEKEIPENDAKSKVRIFFLKLM